MNARIIKETRSLLPVFCVTLLAAVTPRFVWSREMAQAVGICVFTICCLIMGASCFGNEYQWRTMPLLLAQPVPRRRIWNEKMLVLGTALGLGLGLFLLCFGVTDKDTFFFLLLFPICVFSTAPYMALEVKNTLMAAVLTVALPLGICASLALVVWAFADLAQLSPGAARWVDNLLEDGNDIFPLLCVPTAIYCVVCYRLGYRSFIKLQAIDSQAREVALPARLEALLARPMSRILPGYSGPWASLFRKELQIQKTSFLLAGVMGLAALLAALAWNIHPSDLSTGFAAAPVAILVFIIPFITTGVCVAEERAWGVSGWQMALPATARKQWAAKMLTVVFVSVLLGILLPMVLWMLDGWVFHLPFGPGPWHWDSNPPTPSAFFEELLVALDFVLGYLLFLGVGVFASSTSANSARAIITGIALIITGYLLVFATCYEGWKILKFFMIGRPVADPGASVLFVLAVDFAVLLGLVQRLAYLNFRNGEPGSPGVWGQLAIVGGAIVAGTIVSCIFVFFVIL